jgi:putative ABC transport system permease protein
MSWRSLVRDARAGQLWLLVASVVLAVGAMSSVGFFADRLQQGLQRDARQLLGGDAVVASDRPLPMVFEEKARQLGLQRVVTLSFPTMARTSANAGDVARLVSLKAVSPGYPLRGNLQLSSASSRSTERVRGIPEKGTAWVEASLLQALGLTLGDTLLLGESQFAITRLVVSEPDRGAGFVNFAPRVMVNQADLAATGLIQPASRITYRFAVASQHAAGGHLAANVQQFVDWATPVIKDAKGADWKGLRLETLESGRPEMSQTLERARNFLNLVALLSALLGALALAITARHFAQRQLDAYAVLRVLGMSQRSIAMVVGLEFLWVGLMASALGVMLAFGGQALLVQAMGYLIMADLPAPTWRTALTGLGMGLALLMSFGLMPVLQLARVPPLRVIRRDMGPPQTGVMVSTMLGLVGVVALLALAGNDLRLGLWISGGFLVAGLVFLGLAWRLIVPLTRHASRWQLAPWVRMAIRQMGARPLVTALQVSSLSLGLLAVLVLVLMRTDLIANWRQASAMQAPDRFVINVMPDQADAFVRQVRAGHNTLLDWYPMMRGRLVQVNGRTLGPDDFQDERAKRLVDREFNLSNSPILPSHNTVTAGTWTANEVGAISMEEGIAKTLNLKIGDRLTFDMGGIETTLRISSLRRVDWSSMRANFFGLIPVAQVPDVAVTYMGAFKVAAADNPDNALVKAFPNITLIDMRQTVAQVQGVLNQVIRAVEYLFVLSLLAGSLVLVSTLLSTRHERLREYAVMRALGAGRRFLAGVQHLELLLTGALAGLLASVTANGVSFGLAHFVFDLPWQFSWWAVAAGSFAGMLLAVLAGQLALRGVLNRPVVQTLRAL